MENSGRIMGPKEKQTQTVRWCANFSGDAIALAVTFALIIRVDAGRVEEGSHERSAKQLCSIYFEQVPDGSSTVI